MKTTEKEISFFVDYSKSIKGIINGDYHSTSFFNILFSKNFYKSATYGNNEYWILAAQKFLIPKELVGKSVNVIGVLFVSYNNKVDRNWIIKETKKDKCRPANVYELLAFIERNSSNSDLFKLGLLDDPIAMTIASIDLFPDHDSCLAVCCYESSCEGDLRNLIWYNYGPRGSDYCSEAVYYLGIRE